MSLWVCVINGYDWLRIVCFVCVDSILTMVLVKIYTFYCSVYIPLSSPVQNNWIRLFLLLECTCSCCWLLLLLLFLRVRVWVRVCVCSQHCCWLFGLSCFSIDILWKNLSCPELLFPSFLCLSYVCGCCCCCCVCICLLVHLFLSAQWEQLILPN